MTKSKKTILTKTCEILMTILVLLFLLPTKFLQARELRAAEVRSAFETWVHQVTADARPDAFIERMEPYRTEGQTMAYIVHLQGGGFCLCGADDLVLPVYLYSPDEIYDPQNPDCQYFLWEIEARTRYLRQGLIDGDPKVIQYQEDLAKRAAFWQDLVVGRTPLRIKEKTEPMQMELNLNSTWSQGSPYNDLCPELTPAADEHCVAGCAATAMSQIMYYWRWPHTGQDDGFVIYQYYWRNTWDEAPLASDPNIPSHPNWVDRLEWTATGGGKLRMNGYWDQTLYNQASRISEEGDYQNALATLWYNLTPEWVYYYVYFGGTTYDWNLMEDDHTDPPDPGDVEAAKLCYHAGVASGMKYGLKESGANPEHTEDALQDHFHYDTDAAYGSRNIYAMTDEIQWLRPLQLNGWDDDGGGHSWVVLGYNKWTDPDRQFLMNMGWGGSTVWYSCDSIAYHVDQVHTIGIAPVNVIQFVGNFVPGDGSPNDPYMNIEEAIAEAPDGATLIFRAGSDNTFSGSSLEIDRPLTLKGKNVNILKTP